MKDDKKNHKKIFLREFDLVFSKIQDKKISDSAWLFSSKREKREKKTKSEK